MALCNGMQGCFSERVYARTLSETFLKLDPKLAKGATGDGLLVAQARMTSSVPAICL